MNLHWNDSGALAYGAESLVFGLQCVLLMVCVVVIETKVTSRRHSQLCLGGLLAVLVSVLVAVGAMSWVVGPKHPSARNLATVATILGACQILAQVFAVAAAGIGMYSVWRYQPKSIGGSLCITLLLETVLATVFTCTVFNTDQQLLRRAAQGYDLQLQSGMGVRLNQSVALAGLVLLPLIFVAAVVQYRHDRR